MTDNTMRKAYREPTAAEKELVLKVKDLGDDFYNLLTSIEGKGSRELSLAKTKVEEAVMWAAKHITA